MLWPVVGSRQISKAKRIPHAAHEDGRQFGLKHQASWTAVSVRQSAARQRRSAPSRNPANGSAGRGFLGHICNRAHLLRPFWGRFQTVHRWVLKAESGRSASALNRLRGAAYVCQRQHGGRACGCQARGDKKRGGFSATSPIPSNQAARSTAANSPCARGHSFGDQMECPIGAIHSPWTLRSAASSEGAMPSRASCQPKGKTPLRWRAPKLPM